jgi:hypothetical protein
VIDTSTYDKLITSEHNQKPNFMAMVDLLVKAGVDLQNVLANVPNLFDVNVAVGDQLDKIGTWVGIKRNLPAPIGMLGDNDFRVLVQAVIAANSWDGTVPGAYKVWNVVFALEGFQILLQDNQDMTMTVILLTTSSISAAAIALIKNGYIALRPAGVLINAFLQPSGTPVFGFDVQNANIAGFDTGFWLQTIPL